MDCSLEGDEFETDEANLEAWQQMFGQRHYWAVDVGPATFIGLSTTRFRRLGWGWVGCLAGNCCGQAGLWLAGGTAAGHTLSSSMPQSACCAVLLCCAAVLRPRCLQQPL